MIDALNFTNKVQSKIDFLRKYFKDEDIASIDSDVQLVIIHIENPEIQETIDQPEFDYELKAAGFISKKINYSYSERRSGDSVGGKRVYLKVRDWNDTLTLKTYNE